MGNFMSNQSDIKKHDYDNFITERILSSEPNVRVGVVKHNNMQYGSQALRYNMGSPCRLLNYHYDITEINPIKTVLCYDFEDDFKLCFKKNKNSSDESSITMILENNKANIHTKINMHPSIVKNYKPLGWRSESDELDKIDKYIKET